MEELHIHFSIIAKIFIAIEVYIALEDEKGGIGGVLYEGKLDCHLQVHPDCSEAGVLLAVDTLQ